MQSSSPRENQRGGQTTPPKKVDCQSAWCNKSRMKILRSPILAVACLFCSVALFVAACGTLRSEFQSSPTTNTVTGAITPALSNSPPIVPQLKEAAQVAGDVIPQPWGGLVQATLLLMAGGASAYATFHARGAANASVAATSSLLSAAALQTPPPKV